MEIYISHSTSFNYQNELYSPIKESEIFKKHHLSLPHDSSESLFITKEMLENKQFDLIIAEVSYPSTGQGIELGWANMYDIPIICIYKSGTKYSSALSTVTNKFFEYENLEEVLDRISHEL